MDPETGWAALRPWSPADQARSNLWAGDQWRRKTALARTTLLEPPKSDRADDRYQIIERLGKGGSSEVFLARDTETGGLVALKRFTRSHSSGKADEVMLARARSEVELLQNVDHPGIVKVISYKLNPEDEVHELAMEFAGKTTFHRWMHSENPPTALEATKALLQAVKALEYLHNELPLHGEQPIMHRDIKPRNIVLTDEGGVVLVDFGIAQRYLMSLDLTPEGSVVGTASYTTLSRLRGNMAKPQDDLKALAETGLALMLRREACTYASCDWEDPASLLEWIDRGGWANDPEGRKQVRLAIGCGPFTDLMFKVMERTDNLPENPPPWFRPWQANDFAKGLTRLGVKLEHAQKRRANTSGRATDAVVATYQALDTLELRRPVGSATANLLKHPGELLKDVLAAPKGKHAALHFERQQSPDMSPSTRDVDGSIGL